MQAVLARETIGVCVTASTAKPLRKCIGSKHCVSGQPLSRLWARPPQPPLSTGGGHATILPEYRGEGTPTIHFHSPPVLRGG